MVSEYCFEMNMWLAVRGYNMSGVLLPAAGSPCMCGDNFSRKLQVLDDMNVGWDKAIDDFTSWLVAYVQGYWANLFHQVGFL